MSLQDQTYSPTQSRDQVHTLFAHTMGLVAITSGLFALGAYLGRNMSYTTGWIWFLVGFGCLIGMQFAIRSSEQLAIFLLLVVTLLTVAFARFLEPRGVRSD